MTNKAPTFELMPDDLLLSMISHVLPRGPKQAISYNILAKSEILKTDISKRGIALLKFPDDTQPDEAGYFVLHWPSFMRWLLNSPAGQQVLNAHGLVYKRGEYTEGNDVFDMQWRQWKSYFETRVLPPGSVCWDDRPAFERILNIFPEGENDAIYATVFRAGFILTWPHEKNLYTLAQRWKVLHQLHELTDPVLERLPVLLQVLVAALRASKGTTKGFVDYGLAWTRHGLFFQHSRALATLQSRRITADMFPNDRLTMYCASWIPPEYYELKVRLPGATPLKEISQPVTRDYAFLSEAIHPFHCLIDNQQAAARQDPASWDTQHARFFPVTGKKHDNLFTYLENCLDLSKNPEKLITRARNGKAHAPGSTGDLRARYNAKRSHTTYSFSIAGSELAKYEELASIDGPPETLSMSLYHNDGLYYMSAPLEVQLDFPALFDKKYFSRSSTRLKYHYKLSTGMLTDMPIVRHEFEDKRTTSAFAVNGSLFFHPDLLRPGGEVDSFIDFLLIHESHRDKRSLARLKWYQRFLIWLNEPERFFSGERDLMMGDELTHLVDPESPCPIKLTTRTARYEFFWSKAIRKQHKELCWMPPQGQSGDRPPRIGTYDQWALWYGSQELTKLLVVLDKDDPDALPARVKLTPRQQAAFLCYRWLPWRTPASLTQYVVRPNYAKLEEKQRLPVLPTDYDMQALALDKLEEWGYSYSQLAF